MRFLTWKFINSCITQKPLGVHYWNLYAMWVIINGSSKPSLGVTWSRDQNVAGRKWAESEQFWTDISRKMLILIKWFELFEHPINRLSFGYVRLPQLVYYFSCFFLTFFLFLLWLSTFKPLNALYSTFERLKISGRTSARMKLGEPGWGGSPSIGPSKILNF